MLKEERIREISKCINEISEDIVDYRQIYQCTSMIFDAVFGSDTIFESGSDHISVNIQKIASELGMKILTVALNQDIKDGEESFYIANTVKFIFHRKVNTTFIDETSDEDHRRLAIAIHMYYHLKHYYDEKINISSSLMPCKYNAMEEIIAKIFARMILLPPSTIIDEFYVTYKGEYNSFAGCENQWYEYLSVVAKVPKAEAVIGWQEARIVLKLLDK